LPPLPEIKDGVRVKFYDSVKHKLRPVVRTTLGCHVLGAANPHPDPSDLETMLDGASRRFCRKPPSPDPEVMGRFKAYVAKWLIKHMTPLDSSADTSFETWIRDAPYPLWRKNELRRRYNDSQGYITSENLYDRVEMVVVRDATGFPQVRYVGVQNRYCRVNSFQKDETYPCYKAARGINSRTDEFKVRVAPIFKLIEKELFARPEFIKHTPVDERAREIKEKLFQAASHIIGTDYTAFESLFTREFMEACEFQLYGYMSQNLDDTDWIKIVTDVLGGENQCMFKEKFTIVTPATRMSGEMCTSLGNSFANLMAMKFIAKEIGMKSLRSRIEGDDGIFTFYGPKPTNQDFAKLGLIIKIEDYDSLTEGSFCGIIADEDEMINVTNPIESLLDFGWTTRDYVRSKQKRKLELLKAKALSLAYQYPGCPILNSLSKYGLRMCENSHVYYGNLNEYEREIFRVMFQKYRDNVPQREVGFKTRLLVEKRFGVTVEDQLSIERYLDNKTDLSPIEHVAILSNCHPDALNYYDKYVVNFIPNEGRINDLDFPYEGGYGLKKATNVFDLYGKTTKQQEWKRSSFGEEKGTWWEKKASASGARDSSTPTGTSATYCTNPTPYEHGRKSRIRARGIGR